MTLSHISFRTCLLLAACVTLGGCGTLAFAQSAQQMGKEFIFGPDVNLTEKSYAAADYMVHQTKSYVEQSDVIQARALTNLDAPALSSKLARIIPAQVGTRLAQLGYMVDLSAVSSADDTVLQNNAAATTKPDHILTGTYRILENRSYAISLRIIDVETNHISAVFDYTMPRSTALSSLSEPEAKIIVLTE